MNLENIQAGMRVPNYRKLCDLLGEPIEEGNSKNAQIRRWEQYFAYSREKNAYIITEVFPIPHQIQDQRMKYAQHLTPIILRHLAIFSQINISQTFRQSFGKLAGLECGHNLNPKEF